MTRDQGADLLNLLSNDGARRILEAIDEPMTTQEIAATCDIPRSTAYRTIDHLQEAGLVRDRILVSSDGTHPSQYVRTASEIQLHVTLEEGAVTVETELDERKSTASDAMRN